MIAPRASFARDSYVRPLTRRTRRDGAATPARPHSSTNARRNARRRLDELLRRGHVLHHRGHVPLRQLQLVLHHPLRGIELLADDFLPSRVGGDDARTRPSRPLRARPGGSPGTALVHVEPHGHVLGDADGGVGGDHHRDGAVRPVLGGGLVAGVRVDRILVRGAPLGGREAEGRGSERWGRRYGPRPYPRETVWQGRAGEDPPSTMAGWRRPRRAAILGADASPDARADGPRVHERGNKRLDAVLDFVAFAARPMPLLTLLDEAPRRIAGHPRGRRVLALPARGRQERARHARQRRLLERRHRAGAPAGRRGDHRRGRRVHAARSRPTTAEQHEAYKHFEELGEERFPVFLAVPIRGKAGPLGALVVQRSAVPFEDRDIELLARARRAHRRRASARGARRRGARAAGATRRRRDAQSDPDGATGHRRARARGRGCPATPAHAPERAARRAHASPQTPRPTCACFAGRSTWPRRPSGGCASGREAIGLEQRSRASCRPTSRSSTTCASGSAPPSSCRSGSGVAQALSQVARDVTRSGRVAHARRLPRGARARHRGPLRRPHDAGRRRQALGAARARRSSWATRSRCSTCSSARVAAGRHRAERAGERAAPAGPAQAAQRPGGRRRPGPLPVGVRRRHRAARRRPRAARHQPEKSEVASLREYRRSGKRPRRPEAARARVASPRRVTMSDARRDARSLRRPTTSALVPERRRRRRRPHQRHRRERDGRPLRDDVRAAVGRREAEVRAPAARRASRRRSTSAARARARCARPVRVHGAPPELDALRLGGRGRPQPAPVGERLAVIVLVSAARHCPAHPHARSDRDRRLGRGALPLAARHPARQAVGLAAGHAASSSTGRESRFELCDGSFERLPDVADGRELVQTHHAPRPRLRIDVTVLERVRPRCHSAADRRRAAPASARNSTAVRASAFAATSAVVEAAVAVPAASAKRCSWHSASPSLDDRQPRVDRRQRRGRRRPCRCCPRRREGRRLAGLSAERREVRAEARAPGPCCSPCRGSPAQPDRRPRRRSPWRRPGRIARRWRARARARRRRARAR